MTLRRKPGERGTTLIESLVAVALFALTAAATGQLLTQQIRFEGTNSTYTTAIAMAEAELEDLRSLSYNSIASRSPTPVMVASVSYKLTTTVVPDSPAAGMKSITTTVTWKEPNGTQSYSLNAIYTALTR